MRKLIVGAVICLMVSFCLLSAARHMSEEGGGKHAEGDGFDALRSDQPFLSEKAVPSLSEDDLLTCTLAAFLYRAAGDQPYVRQISLAAVVLNRMKHPDYPDTASGVIRQMQVQNSDLTFDFSVARISADSGASTGRRERSLYDRCFCAARLACMGMDPTDGSVEWQPRTK